MLNHFQKYALQYGTALNLDQGGADLGAIGDLGLRSWLPVGPDAGGGSLALPGGSSSEIYDWAVTETAARANLNIDGEHDR